MDSTKIFIDTDNEITFIIEKILSSRTEKVILVIPDRASLLSSITGLKLIKRVVEKSNKLVVTVTLDELGAELCRKVGLIVVARIGEITDDTWEKASSAKFEAMKKDARPRYIPETLPVAEVQNTAEEKSQISLSELLKTEETENQPEVFVPYKEEEKLSVPEVRISLGDQEIKPEIAPAEVPLFTPLLEEPELETPNFLSKESFVSEEPKFEIKNDSSNHAKFLEEFKKELPEEILTPNTPPIAENKENEDLLKDTRVRKKTSSRTNISNLSFSFGKDIAEKKN